MRDTTSKTITTGEACIPGGFRPISGQASMAVMSAVLLIHTALPSGVLHPNAALAQGADDPVLAGTAREEVLISRIKRLAEWNDGDAAAPMRGMAVDQGLLFHIDELLKRFPRSAYRGEALIVKLGALARLARTNPAYLSELMVLIDDVTKSKPKGKLASETAFYAIQAFVYGARREGMDETRRLKGTIERYEAFLADHPQSPRAPVVYASLIRNLLALKRGERAGEVLARLRRAHPDHLATRRAAGELRRFGAVGKPFARELKTSGGKSFRTSDSLGKVLVIHFWSSRNRRADKHIAEFAKLYEKNHARGLEIVSFDIGSEQTEARETNDTFGIRWPSYVEPKGLGSDLVIDNGVVGAPMCFVVDRKGILRSAEPCLHVPELVESLLGKVKPPAG